MKPGDLVQLKGGSPTLTVREVSDDGWVTCSWFNAANYCRADFRPEQLVAVSPSGIVLPGGRGVSGVSGSDINQQLP